MKLKNLKKGDKGKKQSKTQQVSVKVEEDTSFPDDQQPKDDVLISLQADLGKKEQPKKNMKTRMQSNKLVEEFVDTSKLIIEKKQQEKKQITSWILEQKDISSVLAKDFKLQQVDHEFESLTDNKINEQLKKKKEKIVSEKKTDTIGGIKFAPISLGGSLVDSKNTDKLVLGKPRQGETTIPFMTPAPTLNFTNTKLNQNVQVQEIEKTPQQLREEQMERKMKDKDQQRAKLTSEINPPSTNANKGGWFKKSNQPVKAPVKEAQKMEFKPTTLAFTNSAGTVNNDLVFQPIAKTKQEQMMQKMEKADQSLKFSSKKEQQQRRKAREAINPPKFAVDVNEKK